MTALLELKQRIKNLYSQYEIYILPVLRFVLAMAYFIWINTNMGYMKQIDNIFIVLILALICSILPSGVIDFCRICPDGRTWLCTGDRSCRFYACADPVYGNSLPEIQFRQ